MTRTAMTRTAMTRTAMTRTAMTRTAMTRTAMTRTFGRRGAAGTALVVAVVLGACGAPTRAGADGGGSAAPVPPGQTSRAGATVTGTLDILAAASLREAFTTLTGRFEAAHPGVRVATSFGASSSLAQSVVQGSPADVFASADRATMDRVVQAGAARAPQAFAANVMEIAVPPSNPAGVTQVDDLARPGVKVALCQRQVPCGAAAAAVFAAAHLTVTPVTQEVDVKAVLTKVQLGEVDAGLVYVTDVRAAAGRVVGVRLPDAVNASTTYEVAALAGARNPDAAAAFVAYLLSAEGQSVLTSAGFRSP